MALKFPPVSLWHLYFMSLLKERAWTSVDHNNLKKKSERMVALKWPFTRRDFSCDLGCDFFWRSHVDAKSRGVNGDLNAISPAMDPRHGTTVAGVLNMFKFQCDLCVISLEICKKKLRFVSVFKMGEKG